jgi:hypothetical protein
VGYETIVYLWGIWSKSIKKEEAFWLMITCPLKEHCAYEYTAIGNIITGY